MATLSAFSSPASWSNSGFPSNPAQSDTTIDSESSLPLDHNQQQEENDAVFFSNSSTSPNANNPLTPPPQFPVSVLHLTFNQDQVCFVAGTDYGLRVYNCDPFCERFRRDFDRRGGIGVAEMLFQCNLFAVVGGGPDPQYPPNKVMIWDDHQSRFIGELTMRSVVRALRLRGDCIVVVLEHKVWVYNFENLKVLQEIETIANPRGLCAVSYLSGSMVLVCPGLQKGQVRVEHCSANRTKFIMAHDSRIACLALTSDGQLLATASSKGTLIRVFKTVDGTPLREVRRGADRAEIHSLAFSSTAQWLAVSSDKGTVHIFSLKANAGSSENAKSQSASGYKLATTSSSSSFSFFRGVLPKYFNSEWSVAQFRLVEGSQYIVAFGHQKNTVIILGMDGSFRRCQFDPVNGGEMIQLEYHNFLKPEEAL